MDPTIGRLLWEHGWKLFLLPLFFDVSNTIKYVCAAIVAASLIADIVRWTRHRRQAREAQAPTQQQ
jgi:hypothetical protein